MLKKGKGIKKILSISLIAPLAFVSLFVLREVSFATQVISVKNNSLARVKISEHDYTRIFIDGDRISDVKGVAGQYNLRRDSRQGDIYIVPTEKDQDKPFNIFISTENGKNYQLLLTPAAVHAESVELSPPEGHSPAAAAWEASTAYVNALSELMKDMYNGESPDGYSVVEVSSKPQPLGNIASVTLVETYSGDHLRGNVYTITNLTDKEIRLSETQLYKPGARAIALEDQVIPAKGETRLFMVVSQ